MAKKILNTISFDDAVAEGKKIVTEAVGLERSRALKLGELAASVETIYGDHTLTKFAKEIGIAGCTLRRHRSVYEAWKDKEAPGPTSYAVLRELQRHPARLQLVKDDPAMTKAEAREHMRKHDGKAKAASKSRGGFGPHTKRWFADYVALATDIIRESEVVSQSLPKLREVVEPPHVQTLRKAAAALQKAADHLEHSELTQVAA